MQQAASEGKPLLVDFSAEWCVACKELEHFTFSDDRVIELSKSFVSVRVDATRQTPEIQTLVRKYGIRGLPWVAFVTPDGTILEKLTVKGFIDADAMLERMRVASSRWPLPERLPARVPELARRVESYYESGENPKQRKIGRAHV